MTDDTWCPCCGGTHLETHRFYRAVVVECLECGHEERSEPEPVQCGGDLMRDRARDDRLTEHVS